ncbi:hypothetical protein M427DRAFT_57854 [Gonapodya prolifera JEL478]|uniref:Uncharacterized protein n=1 Tax=Gonapodya prolifera (strain JEL478) TaxID=1344416 RepID=A0A139AB67_GONPJ|nr:hypothetical protein M427DRAFT_57854 [Gonapodya prolifera JEL478]|eukprot:KXS14071.1 hypothetical protein M427DRAFT_57854 [Gonapodya prolifera JEL478]
MTEIQNIQGHFLTMLTAFSDAIKKNRALIGGKTISSNHTSGLPTSSNTQATSAMSSNVTPQAGKARTQNTIPE